MARIATCSDLESLGHAFTTAVSSGSTITSLVAALSSGAPDSAPLALRIGGFSPEFLGMFASCRGYCFVGWFCDSSSGQRSGGFCSPARKLRDGGVEMGKGDLN